jgi:hypothetical protein
LISLLAIVGCGSAIKPPPETSQPLPESSLLAVLEQASPLPPGDSARIASYIEPAVLQGIATVDDFGNVVYGASAVELLPPAQQLAGAVYALPVNGFSYNEIAFDITFDDATKVWLGIGDYHHTCWHLTPAHDGITSVAPPYPTAHAPDGNTYFAVLAWNDASVTVNEVSLTPNLPSWQRHRIDSREGIGLDVDMVLIGDYLYVAYDSYDSISSELQINLARATEVLPADGADWDLTVIDDSNDASGLDLAEVNNLPALIFAEG